MPRPYSNHLRARVIEAIGPVRRVVKRRSDTSLARQTALRLPAIPRLRIAATISFLPGFPG